MLNEPLTVLIKVTDDHISKGECRSVYQCAFALAIKEALPNYSYVGVSYIGVDLYTDGVYDSFMHAVLDMETAKRIIKLDDEGIMEPFEVTLNLIKRNYIK